MEPTKPEILSRRHQVTAAVLTAICLSILGITSLLEHARRGRSINIDRPFDPPVTELLIDINSAEWPELTLLPKISETMARRIVEHRTQHGSFDSLDSVQQVKGIGPRTFSRIEPYLAPVAPPNATVDRDAPQS